MVDDAMHDHRVSSAFLGDNFVRSELVSATQDNDLETVRYCLDLGSNPCNALYVLDKCGETSPWRDVLNTILIAFKTRWPNGVRGFGTSALCYAIKTDNLEILDELLQAKLDVNARDAELNLLGYAISQD